MKGVLEPESLQMSAEAGVFQWAAVTAIRSSPSSSRAGRSGKGDERGTRFPLPGHIPQSSVMENTTPTIYHRHTKQPQTQACDVFADTHTHTHTQTSGVLMTSVVVLSMPCQMRDRSLRLKM